MELVNILFIDYDGTNYRYNVKKLFSKVHLVFTKSSLTFAAEYDII